MAQFTRDRLEERGVALPNESTWSLCARAVPIASNVESRIFFRPPRIDCQLKLRLQTNLQSFYESWFNTETNRHSSSQLELVLLIPRKQTKSMPLTGRFSTYDRLPGHWSQNASCRVTRYIHDWVLRRKNCTRMKEGAEKLYMTTRMARKNMIYLVNRGCEVPCRLSHTLAYSRFWYIYHLTWTKIKSWQDTNICSKYWCLWLPIK